MIEHRIEDLICIFNACFEQPYQTRLVKGGDEPIYLPADSTRSHHEIHFAHGYFSSGLHEISHWLIAGASRRLQVDFGYWYAADGRNAAEQALFQQVEVKPQALEWILCHAANFPFRVSIDNLNGEPCDSASFKKAILEQVRVYCDKGLSSRAQQCRHALAKFYKTDETLVFETFEDGFSVI